jgi:2-methylcitrate dehydratase
MIAGSLAAGEAAHSSGMDVLGAIALSYELAGSLGIEGDPGRLGLDQGTFQNVAVALSVGKLWGLNRDQLGDAVSLALVPNLPLGVSRWGDLSMMKGSATSFSTRNGVFAAMLAREGFTSAPEPFEGIYGFHHISGPFKVHLPMLSNKMSIEGSKTKYWPAEGNVQGLLDLVPSILEWTTVDEIDSIEVTVPEHFVIHLADEPKYDPQTRETADHSIPYMLMVALQDGTLTVDSYNPERYLDPALRPLLRKVKVIGSDEYEKLFRAPSFLTDGYGPPRPARIKIWKSDGSMYENEVMYHKGHPTNPMDRDDFNTKLDLCSNELTSDNRELIREAWWNIENTSDIGEAMKTMTGFRKL